MYYNNNSKNSKNHIIIIIIIIINNNNNISTSMHSAHVKTKHWIQILNSVTPPINTISTVVKVIVILRPWK